MTARDVYLTPADVVGRWNHVVTTKTLANWRGQEKGPAYRRIGNRIVYPESAVAAWERANPLHTSTRDYRPKARADRQHAKQEAQRLEEKRAFVVALLNELDPEARTLLQEALQARKVTPPPVRKRGGRPSNAALAAREALKKASEQPGPRPARSASRARKAPR